MIPFKDIAAVRDPDNGAVLFKQTREYHNAVIRRKTKTPMAVMDLQRQVDELKALVVKLTGQTS